MIILSKLVIFLPILFLTGCDLFESREPESPSETKSSYRVPVEPSDVIENLINSFKDKNSNDYKKNFSSGPPLYDRTFYFAPSTNVLTIFPVPWTIAQEFQYFNNLVIRIPENTQINLSFTEEEYDLQADSAIYSATYSISVPVQNSNPIIYKGNLKFFMAQDNSVWAIYYWEDTTIQESSSWSNLKVEFYL